MTCKKVKDETRLEDKIVKRAIRNIKDIVKKSYVSIFISSQCIKSSIRRQHSFQQQ